MLKKKEKKKKSAFCRGPVTMLVVVVATYLTYLIVVCRR